MASYAFNGTYQAIRPGFIQIRYFKFTVTNGGTVTIEATNTGVGGNGDDSHILLFSAGSAGHIGGLVAEANNGAPTDVLSMGLLAGTYILAVSESVLTAGEAGNGENSDDDVPPFGYNIVITEGTATITAPIEALVGTDAGETFNGGAIGDTIWAYGGDDIINGGEGNDLVFAGNGADQIDGGTGDDVLEGGFGNDVYLLDSPSDRVVEVVAGGTDEIRTAMAHFSMADFFANVEGLTGLSDDGQTLIGNDNGNTIAGGSGDDTLLGRAGNDTLLGNDGNDLLHGDEDNDILRGGLGDDELTGGRGTNQLFGEDGSDQLGVAAGTSHAAGGDGDTDTLVVFYGDLSSNFTSVNPSDPFSDFSVNPAGGYDGRITDHLGNVVDFSSIEEFSITTGNGVDSIATGDGNDSVRTGGGNDSVRTGGGNDTIVAGAGNDFLDGGAGADRLQGGDGDDVYRADMSDTLIELSGTDRVEAAASFILPAVAIENLTLIGAAAINGTGNALANTITGNDAANVLDGAGGADSLVGAGGNDTYVVDPSDSITELTGGGTDTVRANFSYTLGAELENLTLTGTGALNGTGNALNNVILGTSGANVLDGGAGADMLQGGSGNDTYHYDHLGDRAYDSSAADGGVDIVFSSVSATLTTWVENLTLTGTADITGVGNALSNVLTGNSGNNVLSGAAGADTMFGGFGNDTYHYDHLSDRAYDAAGPSGGVDTVLSSVSATLTDYVENLTLTGTAGITGVGNALANTITGNGGNNPIAGMAGADVLNGGGGNDSYVYFATSDSTSAVRDQINGFNSGDRIDLSRIDANSNVAGNDAFTFVGAAAFSNTAGELRAYQSGADWFVEGDVNGDGVADLMIAVATSGGHALAAADFVV